MRHLQNTTEKSNPVDLMSSCKGICSKLKHERHRHGNGIGYCSVCEFFIKWDGIYCPCCNRKLSHQPKAAIRRRTYLIRMGIKIKRY